MNNEKSIFAAAIEIDCQDKREAFLAEVCKNNAPLKARVSALLKSADSAGSFLNVPAIDSLREELPVLSAMPPQETEETPNLDAPLIGNYQIESQLGIGGMGTVYLARHVKLNKKVALKVLRYSSCVDQGMAVARFEQEAQAIGRLDHPNIVRALDAGESNGVIYLSMELLDGVDLDNLIKSDAKLGINDSCEIIRQTANGLRFAHQEGMIHRDIKPSNLMLTTNQQNEVCIKILDLGLALMQDDQTGERLTSEGVTMGTFQYMAPEQALDTKSVDHRADIYSLGATFYRLIAGEPPFVGERYDTPAKILFALVNEPTPKLADLSPDAPAEVIDLVDRMLARRPEDRPQSFQDIQHLLDLHSQPNNLAKVLADVKQTKSLNQSSRGIPLGLELEAFRFDSLDSPAIRNIGEPQDESYILRQRVKKFWIDGVLTRTEANEDLLVLRHVIRPDAVMNPWEGVVELPLDSFDSDRPLEDIFVKSDQSMLILGQPGSGKSVTLLQLTRQLLKQSSQTNSFVPVVLHLSTWFNSSLTEWIEQELSAKYQIPRKIGRQLIEDNCLLLILDGLDEVHRDSQSDCVLRINQFIDNHIPPGVVVSCRTEDYDRISHRLKLHSAIQLKPLTPQQIESSLSRGQNKAPPLLGSLKKNDSIMELAKSPLMLSVMKLSFSDASEETINHFEAIGRSPEHMFQAYIDRMFRTKGKTGHGYSKDQTIGWLGWLASRMSERNQSVLQIEQLQPSWFQNRGQQIWYASILCLCVGLMTALVTINAWLKFIKVMDFGAFMEPRSLSWLLVQIPIWLMIIAAFDFRLFSTATPKRATKANAILRMTLKTLGYWALWLVWPLTAWLMGAWSTGWVIGNTLIGLLLGAIFAIQVRGQRLTADIGTVEALGISFRGSIKGWLWGLLVGYLVYQAYLWLWAFYLLDQPPEWFPFYWKSQEEVFVSISWPIIAGACGMVIGGLVPKINQTTTTPNQGMILSLKNAAIAGVFSMTTLSVASFLSLHYWLKLPDNDLEFSLMEQVGIVGGKALWVGFLVALIFGGLDFIKHMLTRRVLIVAKLIPGDLADFLEHAARLSFVKRAGGAYLFSHQLILEYFASQSDEQ
ncbi:MAG: protein kinase [Verrucomicrobiales bacterium]|nr:protein kinase [Verrucomicrobiales bacterium]